MTQKRTRGERLIQTSQGAFSQITECKSRGDVKGEYFPGNLNPRKSLNSPQVKRIRKEPLKAILPRG